MKVSYKWLSSYFAEKLPEPEKLADLLTMHSFEIESIEKVGDDTVFDAKILPDRAHDLLSHVGMAREVSVITGAKIKQLLHPIDMPVTDKVEVSGDPKETPRFEALLIEGVQVGTTPEWLKSFIGAIGQKSINSVVDNTNLTMFHVGQPLHAYDADKLVEKDGKWKLVCEKAGKEEDFLALDGKTYKITPEMLVIRDGNSGKTLGIAGIKGGVESMIDEKTKRIIVEAANFNPTLIRKTSQKLKLRTDASERFEKRITPELTHTALQEFAVLLKEMSPTVTIVGVADHYPQKRTHEWKYKISLSLSDVNTALGMNLSKDNLEDVFKKLGFAFERTSAEHYIKKHIPETLDKPYKFYTSMREEAPDYFSCSSLVSYLYAGVWMPSLVIDKYFYTKRLEKSDLQYGDLVFAHNKDDSNGDHTRVTSVEYMPGKLSADVPINHMGIYVGEGKILQAAGLWHKGKVIIEDLESSPSFKNIVGYGRVLNDISEERFVVTVPAERLDIRLKEDLIEEIGRVHGYENLEAVPLPATDFKPLINKEYYYAEKMRKELVEAGYSEVMTYSFVKKGEVEIANPLASDKKFLRASLLPVLEEVYKQNKNNKDLLELSEVKIFEIGKIFKDGKEILALAKMPEKEEIDLGAWIDGQSEPLGYEFSVIDSDKSFAPISSYPFIVRDIAVFVPEGTAQYELEKIIVENGTELLMKTYLFDEFKKDGQVSLGFRMIFQSPERTLTDGEVNAIMEKICLQIEEKKWKIR